VYFVSNQGRFQARRSELRRAMRPFLEDRLADLTLTGWLSRPTLLCLLLTCHASKVDGQTIAGIDSPNIVFILVDDQGWTGTSLKMDKERGDSMSDYYQLKGDHALLRIVPPGGFLKRGVEKGLGFPRAARSIFMSLHAPGLFSRQSSDRMPGSARCALPLRGISSPRFQPGRGAASRFAGCAIAMTVIFWVRISEQRPF